MSKLLLECQINQKSCLFLQLSNIPSVIYNKNRIRCNISKNKGLNQECVKNFCGDI